MLWSSSPTTPRLRCSRGQQVDQPVLGVVGVLVLVDEHEAEGALVVLAAVREALEQLDGLHEQVVEVHGVHRRMSCFW